MTSHGSDQPDRAARLAFMQVDAKTGEILREVWKAVEPRLPEILEGFYAHATSVPAMAKLIGNQVSRLKGAQATHWAKLFSGHFDDGYMHAVRTIGLTHHRIGLEPRWYIGGYAFVINKLAEILIGAYRWSLGTRPSDGRWSPSSECYESSLAISATGVIELQPERG